MIFKSMTKKNFDFLNFFAGITYVGSGANGVWFGAANVGFRAAGVGFGSQLCKQWYSEVRNVGLLAVKPSYLHAGGRGQQGLV